jgi:predicted RNase H-like nuclease (RuvC/YqgF family)
MIRATQRGDGVKAVALVMPISEHERFRISSGEADREEIRRLAKEVEELQKLKEVREHQAGNLSEELGKDSLRIDQLTNDGERLKLENERLREILESRENQNSELIQERDRLREQLQTSITVECNRPSVHPVQATQRVSILSRRERLQR